MIDLQQQLQEQLAYSHTVAHHLAHALIYVDTLHEKIESCGDVVEDAVFEGLPETEFCYEEAANACVQSDEEALRGVKADAILSVTEQEIGYYYDNQGETLTSDEAIEAYAEEVRNGLS